MLSVAIKDPLMLIRMIELLLAYYIQNHYVAQKTKQKLVVRQDFLHWNAHIFFFGLILWDIPNSITPQTPSACYWPWFDYLYSLVPASAGWSPLLPPPPFFFFVQVRGTGKDWKEMKEMFYLTMHSTHFILRGLRLVPVPVAGVRYNNLLWMCTLNTLTWPNQNE